MSTTVTYKGSTLTTAENQTRVLKTSGKYMEDDVTIVDVSSSYQDGDELEYGSIGETWLFNSTVTIGLNKTWNVNYISDNISFTEIRVDYMAVGSFTISAITYISESTTKTAYNSVSDGWQKEAYRTIVITGGEDEQDSDFRSFLEANAIRQ